MTLPANNPLKLVYGDLYRLNIGGHTNWCTYVEELIKSICMGEFWDEQKYPPSVNDIKLLKTHSKYKRQHNYIRDSGKSVTWIGIPSLELILFLKPNSPKKILSNSIPTRNINVQFLASGSVLIYKASKQDDMKKHVCHQS